MLLWHDPAGQVTGGKVYHSVAEFLADPELGYLSIFRNVEVEAVAQLALRMGDVTLVLDEMDRACTDKDWTAPSVKTIVMEGRHYRVCLWGSFRRTRNVPEDLVSQTDYAFLFRTTSAAPGDIITIRQRFGPAFAQVVQTQPPFAFAIWQDAA